MMKAAKRIGHVSRCLAFAAFAVMAYGRLLADDAWNYAWVLQNGGETPTIGSVTGLVVVVDFPVTNVQGKIVFTRLKQFSPGLKKADIEKMMNGDNYTAYGNSMSVKSYFRRASNGMFNYHNVVSDFILVEHPYEYYIENTKLLYRELLTRLQDPSHLPLLRKLTRRDSSSRDYDNEGEWDFATLSILMAGEIDGRLGRNDSLWPMGPFLEVKYGQEPRTFPCLTSETASDVNFTWPCIAT